MTKMGELLELIGEVGELMPGFLEMPHRYASRLKMRRSTYYYSLKQLQARKFIKQIKKDKQKCFVITGLGADLLRKRSVKEKRSDGNSTIIIFDIPQEKNRERTIFRRYLIRNGFTLIQKSVLVSSYKVSNELTKMIEELNIKQCVLIISGTVGHV